MIKEKLEDICVYKIQAMRLIYLTEQMEKCRNCCGEYYVNCEKYKALKNSQIPYRKGNVNYQLSSLQ